MAGRGVTAVAALLAAAACTPAAAHPTRYPGLGDVNCTANPPFLSFHVHVVYSLVNQDQIDAALALRNEARVAFQGLTGEDCDGRYDNGRLCFILDHPFNTTLNSGPFPLGEWSMFVPVHYVGAVWPYFMQHRGSYGNANYPFSVVLHPNSGCEFNDHSTWASWVGTPFPLDLEIFTPDEQTNEFNQTRGDAGNPVCAPEGTVCGRPGNGPEVPCCADLACSCPQDQLCSCVAP